MNQLDRYFEIREKIIRPALEELQIEYGRQGYRCSIEFQAPPSVSSTELTSQRGASPTRGVLGSISFSRTQPNGVTHTVSIYTKDGNEVTFNKLDAMYYQIVSLDDITADRVKEEVRKAFR